MAVLLTGTTIAGNIALHAGNVSTYALPIGAGTSTGMKIFYTSLTNNDDWQNSPISIMERGLVGNTQSAAQYAPNLNFHWGNRASKSFWLDSSGVLRFGEYNASGVPATDGTIAAGAFSGPLSGNATTATTLQTTRTINGTNFDGSANIETSYWGTARTITIGGTGKSVNGNGNVSWSLGEIQAEYEVPLNTLRNNLGSPTVREAALFHGQFNNKFRFLSPTLQEESTDGTTWVTSTRATAAQLGDMMIGEGQGTSFNAIPGAAVGTYGAYRLTWNVVGSTGYVFLNALYIFNSTNGNNVTVQIEAYHNTNGWVNITGPHTTNNWPGHAYIPHSNIPYSNSASQYSQVRITFTTTHNNNANPFTIYGIEWFGGYPQGRRNAESYDRDRNVYFPASIQGSRLISTVASGTAPLSVTSTTAVGNLNADMVDGYHSSSLWRNDGGSWNPGANILLNQTANNQEWSFDITRNGYTGGYWHVWDSANSTMLKVDAVSGKVSAPYNFVGNLEGSATTLATARTLTIGDTGKTFNGSANVSWTLAEIGAAAASHTHAIADVTGLQTALNAKQNVGNGDYSFHGSNVGITTAQFITILTNVGAFNQPYWVGRGSWCYACNGFITDTGLGDIHLAGCTVEVIGTSSAFTIRIHTPTTSSNGVINREYIYVQNATGYNPGWRVLINNTNYTDFTVTKTGTGASGSWGINITGSSASTTGNAATATALQNGRTLTIGGTGKTFDGTGNVAWSLAEIGAQAAGSYVIANGTSAGNIDSDWGQSFKTFDPIPTGTPPLQSPNIRTINVGEDYNRRTQLAFDYASDLAYFRRRTEAGWGSWREFIHSGNIGSQSVSYATTAGALTSMNISQFTNNSGYITSYTETDTLATVTARGNTTNGSINVNGNILLTGTATTTNQGRMIDFTGFDKEGTTDFSDRAYIQHTVNTGGHAGSVLVLSSQNDADDGIAFLTNASSKLKHNSNNIATEPWVTSQGYITSSGSISGNAATATIASTVTVNSGNTSAAWYPIVWHSGNTVYSSSGVEIYANGNYIRCQYINTTDNDESGITRFVIKNGDSYHRSATTTVAADIIRGVASGTWSINVTGSAGSATTATTANRLERYGVIYGNNWNDYYLNNRLIAASAHNATGTNKPDTAYNYGSTLSYYNSGEDHYQIYITENSVNSNGKDRKMYYRSGWNGSWGGWRSVVDVYNSVCYIDAAVTATGDITAYSDARIKENVNTLEGALDKTLSLRGVSYNRTDIEDKSTKIGFIAQELLEVVPEVVTEDENGMYGVSYGNITALLVEAIKEQQKQIEELKVEIQKLKSI